MEEIICPIDGEQCHPRCIRRFRDVPEGGCLLTLLLECTGAALILSTNTPESEEDES